MNNGSILSLGQTIIKIWDSNKYNCIKTIDPGEGSGFMQCFIEINKNRIAVAGNYPQKLSFYDLETGLLDREHSTIEIECVSDKCMYYDGNDKLLVGGKEKLILVDLSTYQIVKNYEENALIEGVGAISLCYLNCGIIMAGLRNGDLLLINATDFKEKSIIRKCSDYGTYVTGIVDLKYKRIATVGNDCKLRFWKKN